MGEKRNPQEMYRERTLEEYAQVLLGIAQALQYIQQQSEHPLFLDIGTGSGRAARALQEGNPTMRVMGVDPIKHPEVERNLPGKFLQRDATAMPEIQDRTVDGMFFVYSIAYAEPSELPAIVAELKRTSKEGALLKGTGLHPLARATKGLKLTAAQISDALNQNGFVSICASEYGIETQPNEDVFLAMRVSGDADTTQIEHLLSRMIKES